MSESLQPALQAPLTDLARWLAATGIDAVLVGGVAVSLLSRPRFTQDIDALAWLPQSRWAAAIAAAADFGIVPRIDDPLGFAARTRVLLLRHVATQVDIDVIVGGLPFEQQAVEQGIPARIGEITLRLPRVEHLLIMKAIANRPRDQQDVASLLDACPDVDIENVRLWVREFATATSMSGLVEDFERAVARRSRR